MDNKRLLARKAIITEEGRDVYEKLLTSLAASVDSSEARLRYWQEAALRRLEQNTGIAVASFSDAVDMFLICHVHGQSLDWTDGRKVSGSELAHSPEYLSAEDTQFPHSQEVFWVSGQLAGSRTVRVLCCPQCVSSRREWAGQLPN